MIIYKANKKNFLSDVLSGEISNILNKKIKSLMNRTTASNEIYSWNNSLKDMYMVLSDNQISDDIGIALEYNLPNTSKRIDFIITGRNSFSEEVMLIIELKQWEKCTKVENQDMIVNTFINKRERNTTHPSYQAFSYGLLLKDFSEVVYTSSDQIKINTCAYLHNYDIDKYPDILWEGYSKFIELAPLFFKKDTIKLRNYIKELILVGDNCNLIEKIDNGKIKPGKSIQNFVKEIIDGNDDFALIDDQKIVFETLISYIRKSYSDNRKRVVIIPGGPGTGKTLIALRLLSKCLQYGYNSIFVSKNLNLRNVYTKKISDNKNIDKFATARLTNLFKGTGIFTSLKKNNYDACIVDEAHRLILKSQYSKITDGYNNQIKEIICESLVSVFFVDERQAVTTKDIGSIENIKKFALEEGISINNIYQLDELKSQFRTSGADEYIDFINNILYDDKISLDNSFLSRYDFKVFDDPQDMFDAIVKKNTKNNARCVAGYCWEWNSQKDNTKYDIVIDNFKKQWNFKNDNYWIINPDSINQVGCIHTCQGLELEYCGVIIGDDLYYDNIVKSNFFARAKSDKSLLGLKKMWKEDKIKAEETADTLIKNAYKVLLTRGLKGTYIYCTDKKLSNFFKSKIVQ
ncbi:ATP/GTP binding protein [Spiroplasma corruscae]|uniref:ATP/GTP binding protein n=1 Tax=Spiroplasma corruscae TaxID=216934 RepID=A0A222EPV1_9MOLU|nr:DUF2075 domain-containing protein [Spiroplasma corruscae]ASP28476.1 ATP/GTP binding protein [Spiroplasma corruscae]